MNDEFFGSEGFKSDPQGQETQGNEKPVSQFSDPSDNGTNNGSESGMDSSVDNNRIDEKSSDVSDVNFRPPYILSAPYTSPQSHGENSYTPAAVSAAPEVGQSQTPPLVYTKPKKQPKPVTRGGLIIACVCVALAASIITSSIFCFAFSKGQFLNPSSNSSGTRTSIVTDSTDEAAVQAVAEAVSPSVVGIVVSTQSLGFFGNDTSSESEGSGIIYSDDGYIITNYHVISSAVESTGKISVYLQSDSDTAVSATVVGYDVSADLAVVKIDKTGLPAIEIGDSSTLKVGQTAIAVGNPGGMDFMGSVSKGIISGLDRTIQLENTTEINLIQTDAAINPGNSGGALVNSSGQLIGVNSAKMASDTFEGMGFAIPVNDVVSICDRIISKKDAPVGYVGVEISTRYDASTLQMMGYPAGVVVAGVTSGSPAEKAGIEKGDIITQLNGTAVTGYTVFNSEKMKYSPGDEITLTVYRGGKNYSVKLTLGTANS